MKTLATLAIIGGAIAVISSVSTGMVNKDMHASTWIIPVGITGGAALIGGIITLAIKK